MQRFAALPSPGDQDRVVVGVAIRGVGIIDKANRGMATELRTEEMEGQMAFLSGFLRLRPDATVELRYLRLPEEPHRVSAFVLARFNPARHGAEETGAFLFDTLRAWCPGIAFEPVSGQGELSRALEPFAPDSVVELLRRESLQRLDGPRQRTAALRGYGIPLDWASRGQRPVPDPPEGPREESVEDAAIYLALPFLLSDDARDRLCATLAAADRGMAVSVAAAAHRLTEAELSFLEERITRCEKYAQLLPPDEKAPPAMRKQADLLFDACVKELRQFEDAVFDLRIRIASEGPAPEALVSVLGSSLSTHTGYSDRRYLDLENPLYSGGYRVRLPADAAELGAMRREFLGAAVSPHGPSLAPPGLSALVQLFDVTEASTAFRLPLRLNAPFPGLPQALSGGDLVPPDLPRTGVLAGYAKGSYPKREVRLQEQDRLRHLYIVGQTGTGKSTLISSLLMQDAAEGRGLGLIDPHGELVDELLGCLPAERAADLVYLNPLDLERPVPINLLRAGSSLERDFVVNYLIELFYSLWPKEMIGGPMFEMYLRATLMLLLCQPEGSVPSMLDVPRILQSKEARRAAISTCTNELVARFWREEAEKAAGDLSLNNIAPYFTSKFAAFIYNDTMRGIMGRRESTVDFGKLMDEGKILLVDLRKGRLGATNAYFVGMLVVGELLRAALARTGSGPAGIRPRPFHLYVDEFQNVATPSFMGILSEARKYGLGVVLANQYVDQLDERIVKALLGNVGSLAAFRVGRRDAELLAELLGGGFSASDLAALPNYVAAFRSLSSGQILPAFALETVKPERRPDPALRERAVSLSRERYGLAPSAESGPSTASGESGEGEAGAAELDPEEELRRLFGNEGDEYEAEPVKKREPVAPPTKEEEATVEERLRALLDRELESLDLSLRTTRCLSTVGLLTLRDLLGKSAEELRRIPLLGRQNLRQLAEVLESFGFQFGSTDCDEARRVILGQVRQERAPEPEGEPGTP